MKTNYMLLLSLSQATAKVGRELMARIKLKVDQNAAPLWIDAKGIGLFVSTELKAWQIWKEAFPDTLTLDERQALRDLLIVQIGPDFYGPSESKAIAWLNARFPKH